MMVIRRAEARGHKDYGWLDTRHTFSFGDYYDPEHMGFRTLRVINDDRVAPGAGFPSHGHRDMEIVTYVLEGAIAHKDSLGNGSVIRPGDVQRMSAGTGIIHSEYNHSTTEPLHLLQIWILPDQKGLPPGYEQKVSDPQELRAHLRLIASPDGSEQSVRIHQDARLYATVLGEGERVSHVLAPTRHAWVHVARGTVRLAGAELKEGDGAAISEQAIEFEGITQAEVLLFDLS